MLKDSTGAGIDIERSDDDDDAPRKFLSQAESDKVIEVVDCLKNCDKENMYVWQIHRALSLLFHQLNQWYHDR